MSMLAYLAVAVFLPLFPLSMLFNFLYARTRSCWLRMALLLVWPQLGLAALAAVPGPPPAWAIYWAVLTACLYAFRAVALRDLALWTAHMATSAWALLWAVSTYAAGDTQLILQAAGLSAPFVLLAWLASPLEAWFGAAYAGAPGGLAGTAPRLSALLVLSLLAAVGTPLFPAFFVLLQTIAHAVPTLPGAAAIILVVWLLWAWAGAQMTRGMIVGPAASEARRDIDPGRSVLAGVLLVLLAIAGVQSAVHLA